jgi:short-subunit dehydrogenase
MAWLPPAHPEATCLITGASSGIGAAIARELAGRGRGVSLVARREERLGELAWALAREHRVRAEVLACDLADAEQRGSLAGRVESLDLRVDVLVNCAGIGSYGRFVELDPGHELAQVRLMCEAVVDLCGAFAPGMAERRSGAIMLVSSGVGLLSMPGYATYGAAKAFEVAFGESLHTELRSSNVAVTTLCPGPVETDFFAANGPQPAQQAMPRALWKTADEVARIAVESLDKNRRTTIPGRPLQAFMAAGRLAPRGPRLRVLDRVLRAASVSD